MANNLSTVAEMYTARLDRIVCAETKTADLNANQELVGEFVGAGQIRVAKVLMDGLGDYSRANGFPAGDIDLTWETLALAHDRGREFSIDSMDDEERELLVSANVMAEFARTKVVPEVDAIRFATLAANAKPANTVQAALTAASVEDAILAAENAIAENADLDGTILYMTQTVKNLLRKALPYRIGQGENPSGKFETFDEMKVVTVPQSRFYTAIDLYDGVSSGETDGGYAKGTTKYALTDDEDIVTGKTYYTESGGVYTAVQSPSKANISTYYELVTSAGCDINFLMVNPQCCAAIQKHEALRYFSPDINQAKEAHKWQYRLYHDLLVYAAKTDLIYLHMAAS